MTDPYVDIRCGDAIEVMAGMAMDSVDMVCSSPPYWNLRRYAGQQERVWGGKADCKHQWERRDYLMHNGRGDAQKSGKFSAQPPVADMPIRDTTCSLCGAWRGSFGLEPTPELYVEHTLEVLRAIHRVLKPTGVVWWNIGDSYAGSGKSSGQEEYLGGDKQRTNTGSLVTFRTPVGNGLKPLDLCLIPERVVLAAQQDGWYVRSIVVWAKPNPMPESIRGWRWERHQVRVSPSARANPDSNHALAQEGLRPPQGARNGRDFVNHDSEYEDCSGCPKCSPNDGLVLRKGSWRPTDAYEQILMLAKSHEYFSDGEEVREAQSEGTFKRYGKEPRIPPKRKWSTKSERGGESNTNMQEHIESRDGAMMAILPNGRNLRNVWNFPTTSFKGAHFAVYPERLPEICILASTPAAGVCSKCGRPWAREKRSEIGYNDIYEDMHKMQTTPAVDRISSRKTFEGWPKNEVPNMRSGRSQNPLSKSEGDKSGLRQDLQREASRSNQSQEGSISEERNRQNEYVSSEQAISANGEGESKCQRKEPPLFADNAGQDNESSPLQPSPRTSFRSTREFQPDRLAGSIAESETPLLLLPQKVHTEETSNIRPRNTSKQRRQARQNQYSSCLPSMQQPKAQSAGNARIGFRPTCTCKSPSEPALVLDCFAGSGTTGVVAKRLGRKAVLIDISPEYCEMARKRVEATAAPMRLEC